MDDEIMAGLREKLDADSGYRAYVIIGRDGTLHPKRINGLHEVNRDIRKEITTL